MPSVGSLFTGIGGFDVGAENAGCEVIWQVENEPFCQAVLKTHWPNMELFSDVRECGKHNLKPVDVLTAGFPCQDFSVAGKRAGLAGDRSGLFWQAHRIIGELSPTWFVLENVPGFFSSWSDAEDDPEDTHIVGRGRTIRQGSDFDTVINSLCNLGYGLAWRVLDSQYFGVAQRRERVFIVGHLGEPCPEAVLFEPEGVPWNPPSRQEPGQGVTGSLASRTGAGGGLGTDFDLGGGVLVE
jgi:DNA (cytosine-5)-methyltransferase 1